jgi:hypothetical protein
MQTEGAWRVRLYLKGRPLSAAMIVTKDEAQSIIGMNIIGPRRLVMDQVSCTVDFRDEGADWGSSDNEKMARSRTCAS